MVVSSNASEVHLWTCDGEQWPALPPITHVGYHAPLAISAAGKLLAVGWTLSLFDLPSQKRRSGFGAHTGYVYGVAFSPNGTQLASAGHDRSIRIWDVATSQQRECIANHGLVYGIVLSPDLSIVAAMCSDAMRLWQYGRTVEAEAAYREALERLSFSHRKLCDLMERVGRNDDAERHLHESLAGYLQLVLAVPDSAFYRQEAAISYWRLAILLRRGQRPEATDALPSGIRISHDNAHRYEQWYRLLQRRFGRGRRCKRR